LKPSGKQIIMEQTFSMFSFSPFSPFFFLFRLYSRQNCQGLRLYKK